MRTRTAAGVVWVILVPLLGCDAIQDRRTMDKGNKLFAAHNYEQAIPEYQKIVARDAGHWGANYPLGMSYLAQVHPQSTHPKDAKIMREAKAALE